MKDSRRHPKQRSRLDRFLFFSKFVLLVIVALVFVLAYSFSYRDLPVSTVQYHFSDYENNSNPSEHTVYPSMKALIVMDYAISYENDAYTSFYMLRNFVANISNIDYDLVLVNGAKDNPTILNNMNGDLLLRVYQKKSYDYIIAMGDRAIAPSKEIKELFYPSSQIILYSVSSTAISDALTPVRSVSDNIENTILTAKNINPTKNTMLFLCNNDDYSSVVMNIAIGHLIEHKNLSYEVLYADDYNMNSVSEYINERSAGSSVFYVSFLQNIGQRDELHNQIINEIQKNTNEIIYDLSPITINYDIKNSVRYWPLDIDDSPMAYLAISPENTLPVNYELVEFAATNIASPDQTHEYAAQYNSDSAFIGWCMQSIGFEQFPKDITQQVQFCTDNSLFIPKSDLKSGDLIFLSSRRNSSINDIDGIAIYVNDEIMIGLNNEGIICPTKIKSEEYQIYFAHPYSAKNHTEPSN